MPNQNENKIYVGGTYWGPLEITRLIELNSEKQIELAKEKLKNKRMTDFLEGLARRDESDESIELCKNLDPYESGSNYDDVFNDGVIFGQAHITSRVRAFLKDNL